MIEISGTAVRLQGGVFAGQDHPFSYDPKSDRIVFDASASARMSGKAAALSIRAQRDLMVGNMETGFGGQIQSTGSMAPLRGSPFASAQRSGRPGPAL